MNNLRPYEINQNNVTQTWLKINSNSTPTFNSIVAFDINQLGRINELCLLFNMSSITVDKIWKVDYTIRCTAQHRELLL